MGDMNARVGSQLSSEVVGRFGENELNDNGERLIEICEQFDLRITNTFFQHRDIHKYTWQQDTRNMRTIIDYIIIRQRPTCTINDNRVHRGADCGSDHFLLRMVCFWPWVNQIIKKQNDNSILYDKCEEERFNTDLLYDVCIRHLFEQRMDAGIDLEFRGNSKEMYEYISAVFINTLIKNKL